ncbi:S-adenosyl-L-methionine-dependent methyltransferase [Abortiporus biennis]|nr:S-adenosyl-L-methionine-dependent methyltransferase [Abortiporus biennis]
MSDHHHEHVGGHHRGHDEHHHHDFASANESHYDQRAKEYEEKLGEEGRKLTQGTVGTILKMEPLAFNKDTTVLDFACGTGFLSRMLIPHVKTISGVDISQGMVDIYNQWVAKEGIDQEAMKAHRLELKGDGTEFGGSKFDVVVCQAAYHHFASPSETTQLLAKFLKPGGSIFVADILNKTDKQLPGIEGYLDVVPHSKGFTEKEIKEILESGGLERFQFVEAASAINHEGHEMQFFVARVFKPTSASS